MSASVYPTIRATSGAAGDPAIERAHVLRLCRHYTRDAEAAEDLTQEALFEAWRAGHRLSADVTQDDRLR